MEPVEAVLIGAGNRGRDVYARWALAHPERLRITAVAEPDDARRSALGNKITTGFDFYSGGGRQTPFAQSPAA